MPGNPLPSDGVVGRLTDEQQAKLREFWREFFHLVDNAPKEGSRDLPDSARGSDPEKDVKDAGKDIPKDDAAKEQARAERELRDAREALELYGSVKFMACFWRTMMMDDPDMLMLKFLRARKWSVKAGVSMMAAMLKWRMESGVEEVFAKGEEGMKDSGGFLKQLSSGKTYVQGADRMGRPVVYIHVAKHKASDQSPKALEDFIMYSMECVRAMLTPPIVEKTTIVFDMTNFGLSNMDWRCVLFLVKCLEAYYPESLNVVIVHSPPWVFSTIWKVLAPMLDPVVRAKVQMTKTKEELLEHIDEAHLIKPLGGSSEWTWDYRGIEEGENQIMDDTKAKRRELVQREKLCEAYEKITRSWVNESEPNTPTEQLRRYITYQMRQQWFQLDPYVRGRGVYHRKGNIVGNGLVAFDYPNVANGPPEGEWQVLGYAQSREQLASECKRLLAEFKREGIEVPDLSPGEQEEDADHRGDVVSDVWKGKADTKRSTGRRRVLSRRKYDT